MDFLLCWCKESWENQNIDSFDGSNGSRRFLFYTGTRRAGVAKKLTVLTVLTEVDGFPFVLVPGGLG